MTCLPRSLPMIGHLVHRPDNTSPARVGDKSFASRVMQARSEPEVRTRCGTSRLGHMSASGRFGCRYGSAWSCLVAHSDWLELNKITTIGKRTETVEN